MKASDLTLFRALRALAGNKAGATAAEFALVLPLFLLTVFGTINMALAMSAIVRLHYATERAARCLAVDVSGSCTAANIDTYAKTLYQIGSVSGLAFTASTPACGKKVDGTGTYNVFTGVGQIAIGISASACYPVI